LIDRIDFALLRELELDARLSYAELGERVGLSKSPCWKRVQALEQQGVIRSYGAAIDPIAIGLETMAFVHITVAFEHHVAFEQAARRHPTIMACHATVGEADYLLHVMTGSMMALDDFLRQELWRLPGVQRFHTTIAMRTIKANGALMALAEMPADERSKRPE
jgi:Lrp/AsnC family leucine-responsive transcriptional regulator